MSRNKDQEKSLPVRLVERAIAGYREGRGKEMGSKAAAATPNAEPATAALSPNASPQDAGVTSDASSHRSSVYDGNPLGFYVPSPDAAQHAVTTGQPSAESPIPEAPPPQETNADLQAAAAPGAQAEDPFPPTDEIPIVSQQPETTPAASVEEEPQPGAKGDILKEILGNFAVKWAEYIEDQVLNENPSIEQPPLEYSVKEIREKLGMEDDDPKWKELRRTRIDLFEPENYGKVIAQLNSVVERIQPRDPEDERGEKMSDAAESNARQIVKDLLKAAETGQPASILFADGKIRKARLSLGLPEGEDKTAIAKFGELKADGTYDELRPEGHSFYGLTDVTDYMRYGNVIAAGAEPQKDKLRGVLGDAGELESDYLKGLLDAAGAKDDDNTQHYFLADYLPNNRRAGTDDDEGYGINRSFNDPRSLWISTGNLFSQALKSMAAMPNRAAGAPVDPSLFSGVPVNPVATGDGSGTDPAVSGPEPASAAASEPPLAVEFGGAFILEATKGGEQDTEGVTIEFFSEDSDPGSVEQGFKDAERFNEITNFLTNDAGDADYNLWYDEMIKEGLYVKGDDGLISLTDAGGKHFDDYLRNYHVEGEPLGESYLKWFKEKYLSPVDASLAAAPVDPAEKDKAKYDEIIEDINKITLLNEEISKLLEGIKDRANIFRYKSMWNKVGELVKEAEESIIHSMNYLKHNNYLPDKDATQDTDVDEKIAAIWSVLANIIYLTGKKGLGMLNTDRVNSETGADAGVFQQILNDINTREARTG
jgi:hypothetical protein